MDIESYKSTAEEVAKLAPIATTLVAIAAAAIAVISIQIQKGIARKRAAIDFFLKTDLDPNMITASGLYAAGIEAYKNGSSLNAFVNTREHDNVENFLNVHELLAIGVRRKVFDEGVCYYFGRTS